LFRWRVIRLRGSPALWVGDVDAPDEPSAIEEAIKIYNITDPEHQKRLAVRGDGMRIGEPGRVP
jgi:hypothetical protein